MLELIYAVGLSPYVVRPDMMAMYHITRFLVVSLA